MERFIIRYINNIKGKINYIRGNAERTEESKYQRFLT